MVEVSNDIPTWVIVFNDLFFSALGFFLGVWYYNLTQKKVRDRDEE